MIDTHVHVWGPDSDINGISARIETLIGEMDQAGVQRAVLVQPKQAGPDHRYLASAAALAPDRFRVVALIDGTGEHPQATLDLLAANMPLAGIRFRFAQQQPQVPEPGVERDRLFAAIADRQLIVTTIGGLDHHPIIRDLVTTYPGIRFVLDHLGSPKPGQHQDKEFIASLLSFADCPNVYVKLSGLHSFSLTPGPHPDCTSLLGAVVGHFGGDRLMWGSDFPYHPPSGTYAENVRMLSGHLPAGTIEKVHQTAASLWW
jgi:predicted TIM-barrel fold metal-dependent hydrolase